MAPSRLHGRGGGDPAPQRRISFLITHLTYAGAENQLLHLVTGLKGRGWAVDVISMMPPDAYTEELAAAGIPLASLDMRKGVPAPGAMLKLAALLRRSRPQICHSHMVHANLLARVARPLHWVPVLICTAHNIDEGPVRRAKSRGRHAVLHTLGEGSRSREVAYRLTDPFCDLTTNVSRAAVERYIAVRAAPRRKIRFVPNGIDTGRFRPDPAARERLRRTLGVGERFVWLAVARFQEVKDHATLIRAFAELGRDHPEAVLLLVGQGRLEAEIRAQVASFGLTERVWFLGVRSDVPDLMNAADGYVMSSVYEGMPIVLLEAEAVGLPVVATDSGLDREVLRDGENGFMVPIRDPAALARAMVRVIELPAIQRARMSEAGRRQVEDQLSLARVLDQWEELYKELLARKGVGA
jgi:glycosyltransferase involved in cell wall biosynthesis